jgi:hypothetical protein
MTMVSSRLSASRTSNMQIVDVQRGAPPDGTMKPSVVSRLGFLVALQALGCTAQKPSAHQFEPARATQEPAVARVDTEPAAPSSSVDGARGENGPSGADRPIFSGCVVHAGESRVTTHRTKRPGGVLSPPDSSSSCAMNAECIQRHGEATPGDGLVAIECKGKACICTLEPLTPAAKAKKFRVELDAPCATTERARVLLIEQCMRGMKLAAVRPEATPG